LSAAVVDRPWNDDDYGVVFAHWVELQNWQIVEEVLDEAFRMYCR
jgi:hypothetical protein